MKQTNMPKHIDIKHTVYDTHHNGLSEFGCLNKEFYQRTTGATKWTKMKRISLTPKRIKLFYKLLILDEPKFKFTIYGKRINERENEIIEK